jgi:CubicO group peptidase (beta-lactamase class C family)
VTQFLPRSTPEEQGVEPRALLATVDALVANPELHSVMVVRHGHVVAEGWAQPFAAERRHQLFSLTKSFTSTAVGLAIGEGLFGLDDRVVDLLPDQAPAVPDERLARLTVRHLLTMTTGHDASPNDQVFRPDGDWVANFLAVPLTHEPGTYFVYNTAASYVLSAIVQRSTGLNVLAYLAPRVLEPLGITRATTPRSPQGIDTGGWGMYVTTEDIARFALRYLDDGVWQGRRRLPEGWVAQATAAQVPNGDPSTGDDWAQGYGFQFWRCVGGYFRGDGAFGQFCVVVPDSDLVVAITSGTPDMGASLAAIRELLLPGVHDGPVAVDPPGREELVGRLAGLRLDPPAGEPVTDAARRISGRAVVFPDGTEATFVVGEEADEVTLTWAGGIVAVRAGHDEPVAQPLPTPPGRLADPSPTSALVSGTWTAPDVYVLSVRYVETPFVWTVTAHVDGDAVTAVASTNVSFEETERGPFVGRLAEPARTPAA